LTVPYSGYRPEGVSAALGIHLAAYCAVGACFAFMLYAPLQPSRAAYSGVAEYEPPPVTVVTHAKSPVSEPVAPPIVPVAPNEAEPETTDRSPQQGARAPTTIDGSIEQPEPKPTVSTQPRAHERKKTKREIKTVSKPRESTCIPAYDSSGAQTRPCG
jgi:hypothetical protein